MAEHTLPHGHEVPIGIGVGVTLGVALGLALDTLALGMGIGVAIGMTIRLALQTSSGGAQEQRDSPDTTGWGLRGDPWCATQRPGVT
jgi:hypothetical protein